MSYCNKTITDTDNRSKKIWMLLEYIVVNYNQSITTNSLIDLLWAQDENRSALENNLKVCLHRVRELLKPLQYPSRSLILYKRNHFTLNPLGEFSIDTALFEEACRNASNTFRSEQERLSSFYEVFDLYQGRFLSNTKNSAWIIPLSNYYHSLFITTVHDFFLLLTRTKKYYELLLFSAKAITLDELNEIFQYYYILSLLKTGHAKEAMNQYETMIHKYYDLFGVNPSAEFKSLYTELIQKETALPDNLTTIITKLQDGTTDAYAYECNYAIFQHLYQFELHSMLRSGINFYLCLINLQSASHRKPQTNTSHMISLAKLLKNELQPGDVFSRYSSNQYILLLSSTTYEKCMLLMEQIQVKFHQQNPKSEDDIQYVLRCIEPSDLAIENTKQEQTLMSS